MGIDVRSTCVIVLALGACTDAQPNPETTTDRLGQLVDQHVVDSISLSVVRDGQTIYAEAVGEADDGVAATSETIYSLASVSKVVVGLAAARLLELSPGKLDLDADINDVLSWQPALSHPKFPGEPVTLRQLLRHEAGVVANTPADYDTYPKPDPVGDLEAFLQPFLAQESSWLETGPGEVYAYSNVGVALAAHVIEKAAGEDFRAFCLRTLFDPLAMTDTRWFFGDFAASQQARVARPFDQDGEPYEHYGFDDWPSGQLRSTGPDMARMLVMLGNDGGELMSATAVENFETVPMLIDAEDNVFSHAGGESGVNTYLEYKSDGGGYVVLVNSDLDDDPLDALMSDVADLVQSL